MRTEIRNAILACLRQQYNELERNARGLPSRKAVNELLGSVKCDAAWLTRDVFYNFIDKMTKEEEEENEKAQQAEQAHNPLVDGPNWVGTEIPSSSLSLSSLSTMTAQTALQEMHDFKLPDHSDFSFKFRVALDNHYRIGLAMQEATMEYCECKDFAKKNQMRLPHGSLAKIILTAMARNDVKRGTTVNMATIRSRAKTRNFKLIWNMSCQNHGALVKNKRNLVTFT